MLRLVIIVSIYSMCASGFLYAGELRLDTASVVSYSQFPNLPIGSEYWQVFRIQSDAINESSTPDVSYYSTQVIARGGFVGARPRSILIEPHAGNTTLVRWRGAGSGSETEVRWLLDISLPSNPSPADIVVEDIANITIDFTISTRYDGVEVARENIVRSRFYPDRDGDGVTWDNCEYVYNPEQIDEDWDGIGNRCDADFDFPYQPGGFGVPCRVDLYDLRVVALLFYRSVGGSEFDLDGDGFMNFGDLAIVRAYYLADYRDPQQNPSGVPNHCYAWSPWINDPSRFLRPHVTG